jgi:prolyl oligopeptidase
MSTGKSTARTNRIAVSGPTVPWIPDRYPSSRRSDHVDVYKSAKNGEVTVPDPYVWLEENTTETEEWVSVQESFTREYLDQIPDRKRLERAIREGSDFPEVRV